MTKQSIKTMKASVAYVLKQVLAWATKNILGITM